MATTLAQRKEAEAQRLNAALAALARGRSRDRTPAALVRQVFQGELNQARESTPALARHLFALRNEQRSPKAVEKLQRVLAAAATRAPRMLEADRENGPDYLAALGLLARQSHNWLREPEAFRPQHRSPERVFGELARHLLVQYPVPRFLDSLFLRPDEQASPNWFAHLGNGGSPVDLPGLSLLFTRRMGHFFLRAPVDLTALAALRWGQVQGMDGGVRMARAVGGSFLGRSMFSRAQEAWVVTAVRWLALHDDVNPAVVDTLLTYLWHRRREEPGFEVAGRSPLAVLRLAQQWDGLLVGQTVRPDERFTSSGFAGGTWTLGEGYLRTVWRMEEILDMRTLRAEGRAMNHCVATYASEIQAGECAIWSLQMDRPQDAVRRAVTIQVERPSGRIVQVRGKQNRDPTRQEKAVIARWAAEAGLTVAYEYQPEV